MLPRLDKQLDQFVDASINNFVKWDLLVFFHQNPEFSDTCPSIATRLGRREEDIGSALGDLVEAGILAARKSPAEPVFHYSPKGPSKELVERFVTALDSREQRLQILTKLLRMGARG